MNQDLRTCRSCGRWTVCLVEPCERCGLAEVSVCEACVTETEGAVLDVQATEHARTCGISIGPDGRPSLSTPWRRHESGVGRRLSAAIPKPAAIPRTAERCLTSDREPAGLDQADRRFFFGCTSPPE